MSTSTNSDADALCERIITESLESWTFRCCRCCSICCGCSCCCDMLLTGGRVCCCCTEFMRVIVAVVVVAWATLSPVCWYPKRPSPKLVVTGHSVPSLLLSLWNVLEWAFSSCAVENELSQSLHLKTSCNQPNKTHLIQLSFNVQNVWVVKRRF